MAYSLGAKFPFYTQGVAFVLAAVITYFDYRVTQTLSELEVSGNGRNRQS